jgi:hypothetical protein
MPFYFEYEKIIKRALENRKFNVYLINEDFDQVSFLNHAAFLYCPYLKDYIIRSYYTKQIEKIDSKIDTVLIINGRTLTDSLIQELKKVFYDSRFIMYQWDSVEKAPHALMISKYCDKNLTFDRRDAEKFHWMYRPLFFDVEDCAPSKKMYDISFICSLHSQRIAVLDAVEKYASDKRITLFSYMYAERWSFIRQKYIKKNPLAQIENSRIKFKKLDLSKTNAIYDRSLCVLDYKFPEQNGLTMRSIESIGHKCKLITNNINIYDEEFYDPRNVYVYDLNSFDIPMDFILSPYKDIKQDAYYRYTIDGWIDDVLSE